MSLPEVFNGLSGVQGDDWTDPITFYSAYYGPGDPRNTVLNITGWTARMEIFGNYAQLSDGSTPAAVLLMELETNPTIDGGTGNGLLVVNGSAGTISFNVPRGTQGQNFGTYPAVTTWALNFAAFEKITYGWKIVDAGGKLHTQFVGQFQAEMAVF